MLECYLQSLISKIIVTVKCRHIIGWLAVCQLRRRGEDLLELQKEGGEDEGGDISLTSNAFY